jgi:hypothetical protein
LFSLSILADEKAVASMDHHRIPVLRFCLTALLLIAALCMASYAAYAIWPSSAAQGADLLRNVIGDTAVTQLEEIAFQTIDALQRWEYSHGKAPQAPWIDWSPALSRASIIPTYTILADQTKTACVSLSASTAQTGTSKIPTPIPALMSWHPPTIPAMGDLSGEGQWIPYLFTLKGEPIAYRTFLQPDPDRPYAIATLVAIDVTKIRLHYVPGYEEPASKLQFLRSGRIPGPDRDSGDLLAAFNGGFLTRHGSYGVMINGLTLVPMRLGMGTLAIGKDDHILIGEWGTDINSDDEYSVLRQNGPMIIADGEINPRTNETSISDWGATLQGEIATWRSAIGISEDGTSLYYLAGWNLTMPPVARSLKAAGAHAAIQLDINNYWVLFTKIEYAGDEPKAIPLVRQMTDNVDRYLFASARDFFYVTAIPVAQ